MVNKRLVSYIKQQISAGYDINTIKNFLIRRGYNQKQVDEAVNALSRKEKKKISLPVIIGSIVVVLIVFVFIALFMIGGGEEITKTTITPEEFEEEVEIEEIETAEEETIEEISEEREEVAPQERETLCGDGICGFGENYLNCPQDCEPAEASPEEVEGEIMTRPQIIDKVIALSTNPNEAAGFCAGLDLQFDRDVCYDNLAEASQTSSWCEEIVDDNRRDGCYSEFVLKGDYSVCGKLTNKYLKESCYSLRAV